MIVKSILTTKGRNVITTTPEQTIKDVVILLDKYNIGALVVLDGKDEIAGIISERDIIRRAASQDDVLDRKVSDLMTTNVITGLPQDDIKSVSNTMTEKRIRHLPITDGARLVGIVSIGDIVKIQRDTALGVVDTLTAQVLAE